MIFYIITNEIKLLGVVVCKKLSLSNQPFQFDFHKKYLIVDLSLSYEDSSNKYT